MKLGIYSPLVSIGLCLWMGACQKDTAVGTTHTTSGEAPAADNTKVNEQDNPGGAGAGQSPTPMDQGNGTADLAVTQRIRQALIADDALSEDAKNVKVITADGVVTLRGPVKSRAEKAEIAVKVSGLAGGNRVEDQIDVEDK